MKVQGYLELKKKNLPLLKEDEHIIKNVSCGFCQIDSHIYIDSARVKNNTILGQKFNGVVVDKWENCRDFSAGEKEIGFAPTPVNLKIELNLQKSFRKELSIKTSFSNSFAF